MDGAANFVVCMVGILAGIVACAAGGFVLGGLLIAASVWGLVTWPGVQETLDAAAPYESSATKAANDGCSWLFILVALMMGAVLLMGALGMMAGG